MSATPSKLFVGFIGFIISVGSFSGVGIAEQIVETESRVVLEVGTRGILPCRIQTKAHLVQWTWWAGQLTSEHFLVYLDTYSNVLRRGGPGYTKGLFNITEDYSLIIKDVKVQDEGLYICEVSDFQTEKLFRNKTRVSVRGTGASAALDMGAKGILPCGVQRGAYEVKWKRQLSSDISETELLVSFDQFFNVGERDGPGYKAGLFNITDDYSLVIKDVKAQDEGLYMCTLFDYKTGRVFRNSTRVFVQAFPEESFPIIQECVGKDVKPGVCTLIVHSTSNLTCFVKGYYPDIDLFFLHGSEKVTPTEYEEWNNADGTKNKKIRVQVGISKEPYKCVASSLPGIVGNRSLSVIVHGQNSPPTHSQGPIVAAIVVSVLMIVGICLSIALIRCRVWATRHGFYRLVPGTTPVRVPEGPVSKPELWTLVKKAKEKRDFKKLKEASSRLGHLSKADASKLQKDDDFYESLCKWKSKTSSDPNQRKKLYSACSQVGMFNITRALEEFVLDTNYDVSSVDINHVLWEIGDTRKISELLKAFELAHEEVAIASEKGLRDVIDIARKKLLIWRHARFQINPVVILSLKLDDLQCETDFFKLSISMKEEVDERTMQGICCRVFQQHCEYLVKAIRDINGEVLPLQIRKFVEEDNASLFNVLEMLRDWVRDAEYSNYNKRNQLLKAAIAATQRNHTDAKWPPDDDLRIIGSFLSPASMRQLCSELGIQSPLQEASEEERFQALTDWRDNHTSSKDLKEKHTELFTALKEVELGGLIPRAKGDIVYKAELVDLAFQLFSHDLLPFTEALGISAAKLNSYKLAFHPSHMTKGTISLVCKLFESRERAHFLKIITKMPDPNLFARGMLAPEISCGEVCAISVGPANRQKLERMWSPSTKPKSMLHGDHNSSIDITVNETSTVDEDKFSSPGANLTHGDSTYNECVQQQSQNEIYNETMDELATMLTLANNVKDHDQVSPESLEFIKYFKVWRERPRLAPLNSRLAIAYCLRSEDNYDQISAFLRGDCNKGRIPFTFISNTLQTMDPEQRSILAKLMGDASFTPLQARLPTSFSKEYEWSQLTDAVSRNMHAWIEEWIQQITKTKCEKGEDGFLKTIEMTKKHKEFNDKLVDHGFFDLAREIMICER